MKKKKILAALLAAALIIGSFGACGNGGVSSSKGESQAPETSSSSTVSQKEEESTQAGQTAIPASDVFEGEVNQQTYPITEEKITLRLWYPMAGSMGELADFNDAEFFKWYEEKTGIHIDFVIPASGTEADAFSLLFASDNMPDMMYSQPASQKYRGGEDAAIEDGYFADMMNYLEYAPNYVSWLNSHKDWGKACMTDTGKMYGMWGVWQTMNKDGALADQGIAIRQDFLKKVDMEVPTTYEEWEKVLTAFKEKLGIEAPLYTSKYGIDFGEFMAGYSTAIDLFNSIINFTVLFTANFISKRVGETSLW